MLSGKRGFTLVEVMVVLFITALMLPAIGMAFFQLMKVPPQESDELTMINEVSLALRWMNEDGMMAQYFSSAPDEPDPYYDEEYLYGGFYWVDRTSGNVSHTYATRYYYDNAYHVIRRAWKDNQLVSTDGIAIAHHIADFGDVSFEFYPHGDWPASDFNLLGLPYVVVTMKASVGQGTWVQWAEGTQYIYLRGSQTLSNGFAVLTRGKAIDSIDISGANLIIDGDIRSYGGISISGGDHTITGWAQAAGVIDDAAGAIPDEREEQYYPLKAMSWNLELSDFLDPENPRVNEYVFTGDVSLNYPSPGLNYWVDATTLKPGVYYTDGTMTLATNNASGMVTLIGDKVEVTADNTQLTPFCNGVLLYGTGQGEGVELEVSGDGGNWHGILFAPYGEVVITGSGVSLYGAIAALTFTHENTGAGVRIEF